jgi:energy-coupling factor transporter transmembrane protein EcfT
MLMLETLSIDDVIEVSRLDLQKAQAKKSVRQVAGIFAEVQARALKRALAEQLEETMRARCCDPSSRRQA